MQEKTGNECVVNLSKSRKRDREREMAGEEAREKREKGKERSQ